MAEKLYQMEEDCVEYYLFPNLSAVDSTKSPKDALNDCIDSFLANLSSYLVGYIWQNESFSLRPIDTPNENIPPHIYGSTKFGDNIDDEWFIVFLLFELSKMYSDLIIRVVDNDGEFLLIEMAENLPKWLTPETSENRVFIHQGSVHIVPKNQKTGPLSNFPSDTPTVSKAVTLIRDFPTLTKCSPTEQSAVIKRISSYPNKIKEDQHVAHCYLPASLAVILKKQPSLLSAAVQAFYTRDVIDLKACRMMKYFPPETRVMTAITFTKCLYAQLIQQKYVPDKLIGWGIPPVNNPHFKSFDLGMKLACGFEILVSNCKQKKNSVSTPTPSELYSDIRWQRYIKSLQTKGYFRGELEGSKLYNELIEKAQQYYCSSMLNNSGSSSQSAGQQILSLIDSIDIDLEQLREEAKNLQPPDDDSWLELTPETLDSLLQEKFSSMDRNALHDEASTAIVEGLKKFINHPSGIDGAEFPSRNDEQTNKNNKSKRITMDPDAFADAYQSILDFKLPDWEEGSSTDMSDYSDDDELKELDLSKPSKGNRKSATKKMLNKMEEYMEQMDRELASTQVGQSFERLPNNPPNGSSGVGDKEDTLENYTPVDVDLSALRNILESYQSQQGLAGPASNIMHSMGIELPQNADQ